MTSAERSLPRRLANSLLERLYGACIIGAKDGRIYTEARRYKFGKPLSKEEKYVYTAGGLEDILGDGEFDIRTVKHAGYQRLTNGWDGKTAKEVWTYTQQYAAKPIDWMRTRKVTYPRGITVFYMDMGNFQENLNNVRAPTTEYVIIKKQAAVKT